MFLYLKKSGLIFSNMKIKSAKISKKRISKKKSGKGVVNSIINKLPFELHVPSYQYCGPGTKLKKRLQRNDPGINGLDRACREHDIAYAKSNNITERNLADNILSKKAWERFKSRDAGLGERAVALGVSGIMKAKSKMGLGMKKTQSKKKSTPQKKATKASQKRSKTGAGMGPKKTQKKKNISVPQILRMAIKNAKGEVQKQKHVLRTVPEAAKLATQAAKIVVQKHKVPKAILKQGVPRIIPVPKIGGVLPLVPIFAGLSALGALLGGTASVANAALSANNAKGKLNEAIRHNQSMESIAIGRKAKTGAGLRLGRRNKTGLGLYLAPYPKNE